MRIDFARNDVDHVDWSTVVVGIMDGSDPDSGTAWEIGYAYAKGTPIILRRTELATPTIGAAADALIAALTRLEAAAG